MARSTYIYVVLHDPDATIAATFTVKHELARWLRGLGDLSDFRGYRCHDACFRDGCEPVEIDLAAIRDAPARK